MSGSSQSEFGVLRPSRGASRGRRVKSGRKLTATFFKPLICGLLLSRVLFSVPVLLAATWTVANTNDDGSIGCLRSAILNATNGDTINFTVTGTITLTNGELLVTNNLTIAGPGVTNLAVSGNSSNRVLEIVSNATVSVSGLTLRDGRTAAAAAFAGGSNARPGGGIYNAGTLTLSNCIITRNVTGRGGDNNTGNAGDGGDGGGIFNLATLTLEGCSITGNYCGDGGDFYAGPYFGSGGAGGKGGGICSLGQLNLTGCTLNGNFSGSGGGNTAGGSGGLGGDGGGVYNAGTASVTSCTISANGAGHSGGGVFAPAPRDGNGGGLCSLGPITLTACTLGENSRGFGGGGPPGQGGGIFASSASLRNCLVAQSAYPNFGLDVAGSFMSRGHNLIGLSEAGTGFTNGVNADLVGTTNTPVAPRLGPLQDNGGPTFTLALLHGSPALDAGDDALLGPPYNLTTDQRGFARDAGAHVDIGAFEFQPIVVPPALGNVANSGTNGFQFTFSNNTPGATFSVLSSTNVSLPQSNWVLLGQPTQTGSGRLQFIDPQTTNYHQRFYRVSSP